MTKFLIVEDNREMCHLIKSIVGKSGDEIYECADGDDAFAAYVKYKPDWVLMDFEMKRVNGLCATRQIIAEFPDAKILLVTNYRNEDLRRDAVEIGAVEVFPKDDLISLKTYLNGKHFRTEIKTI